MTDEDTDKASAAIDDSDGSVDAPVASAVEDRYEQWRLLLGGELEGTPRSDLLLETMLRLSAVLATDALVYEDICASLAERLSGSSEGAWDRVNRSLVAYFGRETTYLFNWVAEDVDARLEELDAIGPEDASVFLRRVYGRFAAEIENAWRAWQELPDDWKTVFREVYWDVLASRHLIKIRIEKYQGDCYLETTASSFMRLISFLLRTLRMPGTPDAYPEDVRDEFRVELDEALSFLNATETDDEAGVSPLLDVARTGPSGLGEEPTT